MLDLLQAHVSHIEAQYYVVSKKSTCSDQIDLYMDRAIVLAAGWHFLQLEITKILLKIYTGNLVKFESEVGRESPFVTFWTKSSTHLLIENPKEG